MMHPSNSHLTHVTTRIQLSKKFTITQRQTLCRMFWKVTMALSLPTVKRALVRPTRCRVSKVTMLKRVSCLAVSKVSLALLPAIQTKHNFWCAQVTSKSTTKRFATCSPRTRVIVWNSTRSPTPASTSKIFLTTPPRQLRRSVKL